MQQMWTSRPAAFGSRLLAAGATLAACAALGACGGSAGGTSAAAPPPADPDAPVSGTLRLFAYSDTASDVILDPFRKRNPDLDLKTATFDSVQEGAAKLAGGFEADVVNVCSDEYQPLVTRNLLRPIDPAGDPGLGPARVPRQRGRRAVRRARQLRAGRRRAAGADLRHRAGRRRAPDSWADLFDPAYAGRVTIDGGTWLTPIAETAMAQGVADPMKLTDEQVEEAKQKLIDSNSQFRAFTGSDAEKLNLFKGGEVVLADGGRYNALLLRAEGLPVEWVAPKEGAAVLGLRARDHLEGREHRRRLQADQLLRLRRPRRRSPPRTGSRSSTLPRSPTSRRATARPPTRRRSPTRSPRSSRTTSRAWIRAWQEVQSG